MSMSFIIDREEYTRILINRQKRTSILTLIVIDRNQIDVNYRVSTCFPLLNSKENERQSRFLTSHNRFFFFFSIASSNLISASIIQENRSDHFLLFWVRSIIFIIGQLELYFSVITILKKKATFFSPFYSKKKKLKIDLIGNDANPL